MVYYTPSFDKHLKNWSENCIKNLKKNWETEFRDLVNLKLLLNRNELEKDLYMKKMCLSDIYPTAYHLVHSDKRFRRKKTRKNARCHSSSAAPFLKLLLNRKESRKVINMAKLRLIHSFPMVYYTPRSDKRLKN